MAFIFNPEAFVQREPSIEEFSRQQTSAIIGAGENFAQGMRSREQRRQFDSEQSRLRDNEEQRRREQEIEFAQRDRTLSLQEGQFGLQQDKFASELDQYERERVDKGMAQINKALSEADTLEEYNAIVQNAASEYGIDVRPRAQPTAPMAPPPPGSEIVQPDWSDSPGRARRETSAIQALPPGPPTPEGQAVSAEITESARAAAEANGVPADLGVAPVPPPSVTRKPPVQAWNELQQRRPMVALEAEARSRAESDTIASYQARIAQLQSMGLSPEQLQMAATIAAQAHGVPAPPPPPLPPAADPNAPPEAHAQEVVLPQQVVDLAATPPQLPPEIVRDGMAAGGFDFYDARTGRPLGSADWGAVQAERRAKRIEEASSIVDMATDPRDRAMFQAAAESYIANGSKEAYDILKALIVNRSRDQSHEVALKSQERLTAGERLKVIQFANEVRVDTEKRFEATNAIKEMREGLRTAEGALAKLRASPPDARNAMAERAAMSDILAIAATRRATDKDAERFLGKSFTQEVAEFQNYLFSEGALSDERLNQMNELLRRMSSYERHRMARMKDTLRQQIRDHHSLQNLLPQEDIENIAEQAVREVFPEHAPKQTIQHRQDPTLRDRRDTLESRSTSAKVRTSGPAPEVHSSGLRPEDPLMPEHDDKLAKMRAAYDDGTLDSWLEAGKISQHKYDSTVERLRAGELGVPSVQRDVQPPVPEAAAAPAPQPKAPAQARPSFYVAGVGDAPGEDGSWWDDVKSSLPQAVRDFTLLPSHSAVWFEPSDEEVDRAIAGRMAELDAPVAEDGAWEDAEEPDLGARLERQAQLKAEYRDAKWAEAYDAARDRGESIYRARDINDSSPQFMRFAKSYAETMAPVESAARGVDRAVLGGMLLGDMDAAPAEMARLKAADGEAVRGFAEMLGVAPPAWTAPEELAREVKSGEKEAQRRITRASKVVSDHPVAFMAGNLGGALSPRGLTGGLSAAAGRALGAETARGAVGGALTSAAAAGVSDFAAEAIASQLEADRATAAGLEAKPLGERMSDAGMQGLFSAGVGGALGVPGGVSRGMRSPDADPARLSALTALEEGGGGTKFWSISGLEPPPVHEELSKAFPVEGTVAGARSRAANAMADELVPRAQGAVSQADAAARTGVYDMSHGAATLQREVSSVADEITSTSEGLATSLAERTNVFAKRFMDRARRKLQDADARRSRETESVLEAEGAPDYPAVPGPDNMLNQIESDLAAQDALDYGLETAYPSVSAEKLISKHYSVIQRLAFADGANMPNSSALKFKQAVDGLFKKKVVTPEEAPLYENVAFAMRDVDVEVSGARSVTEGMEWQPKMVEVLIPRRLSARELDDFTQVVDEMARLPHSPTPDAMRWAEVGEAARELREEAFSQLAGVKSAHELEMASEQRFLRSLGLDRAPTAVDAGDVDQVSSVLGRIKAFASESGSSDLSGLAVPRAEFERWLMTHDETLFDEYMGLRDLARQTKVASEFRIDPAHGPARRAETLQGLEDMITGKSRKADAVLAAFGDFDPRVRAARAEAKRQEGLFNLLGVKQDGITPEALEASRVKMHQVLLDGGPEFEKLRAALKPEQRQIVDVAREAAADMDSVFQTLGFTPSSKWAEADRAQVVKGLSDALNAYQTHGSKPEFNQAVRAIFEKNPDVKRALRDLASERGFQFLRRQQREGAHVYGSTRGATWHVAAGDFFRYHMDALMGYRQKGLMNKRAAGTRFEPWARSPFGATSQYAMSVTEPVDRDKVGEVKNMSAAQALRGLIAAFEVVEREESR